jgi:DNA-binding NtrC family response regulator
MKEGAYDYVEKDFQIEDLMKVIRKRPGSEGLNHEDV